MRFFENGPSVPDELLIARDEGRVVFFCGAGVSKARANLLDFFQLAEKVIQKLGVSKDSPVLKVFNQAREADGLISLDRIFGLLEREFSTEHIEAAVAETLLPDPDADVSAHRILLDLATTQEGKVRLVTTNFDRLFDECQSGLKVYQHPRLPHPSQHDEIDGIIHLHGRVNKNYSNSEGEGFILSSSEFGHAYLSDGWATKFFKEIIREYTVVFVGYSADDPPIQYLLEALNKKEGELSNVYAFQSGESTTAAERWRHKGVEAIPYVEGNYNVLWATLEAWALRARGVDEWYQSVIDLSKKGPENLHPHERGQVAHIISSIEGVRKFTRSNTIPPAEWLCVFDPYRRYAKPGHVGDFDSLKAFIDPFDLYGLDSDKRPIKIDPDDPYTDRDVPGGAWNAFAASRLDLQNLDEESFSSIRGYSAINMPRLPLRLNQLGVWIANVSDQPASVWWGANQTGLHPDIQRQIKWQLERSQKEVLSVVRQAWLYLFEAWEVKTNEYNQAWYELKALIDKDGWDRSTVRKYATINRPFLKVEQNIWGGPKPPEDINDLKVSNLLRIDVEYPELPEDVKIPDQWLFAVVREFRKNLEHALHLENEIGGYGLNNISPIIPDDDPNYNQYGRTHGLSLHVILFTSLFTKLIKFDVSSARQELVSWPINDDSIFTRLRIWVCGKVGLVSMKTFCQIIKDLSDDAFWNSYHQRDLLLVLAARWEELNDRARKVIEKRLLKGRKKDDVEDKKEYKKWKAWSSLNRIVWLDNNGCNFTFDFELETKKLKSISPEWKLKHAEAAAKPMEGRGGMVRTNTDYSSLLLVPLNSILVKAKQLSGKTEDFLREDDPFKGLSTAFPIRAFSSLTNAARHNEYPAWAWRTFLNTESRKSDKLKFSALIAERICQLPSGAIKEFIYSASEWVLSISKPLSLRFPELFDKLVSKLIHELQLQSITGSDSIASDSNKPDWFSKSLNAPVGKIAHALFHDIRIEGLKSGEGFSKGWLTHVKDMLSLDGDLRRHAIVTFSRDLNWFYNIDPIWTTDNLLSILEGESDIDQEAFWHGIFSSGNTPSKDLYIQMKNDLLSIVKSHYLVKHRYLEELARIILVGWGNRNEETQERYILNDEMRETLLQVNDDFRSHTLVLLKNWSKPNPNNKDKSWDDQLFEFFQDVWPRQLSIKSPITSARLFELACSNAGQSELIDVILPLLTTVGRNKLHIPYIRSTDNNVVDLYPRQILILLYKTLPQDVKEWPYHIEETLLRMSESDSNLKTDERFLELQKKWNER